MRWHSNSAKLDCRLCSGTALTVYYHDVMVGEYFVNHLVDDVLLVDLKTVKPLNDLHMPPGACPWGRVQCSNYLEATGLKPCLLLNFGKSRLEIKRVAQGL